LLLVIFGAGASYDSAPDVPAGQNNPPAHLRELVQHRPPLANDLFDVRALFADTMRKYPECHGIVSDLRNRSDGQSVESVLTTLEAQATQHPARRSQLAAIRFYLRDALWLCQAEWSRLTKDITNYKTLLDRIALWQSRHPQVSLVTFNYDTLLEEALPVVGFTIGQMEDYTRRENAAVFKLHGSVNWYREVELPAELPIQLPGHEDTHALRWMIAKADYPAAAEPKLIQGMNLRNREERIGLFPAIAVPVLSKGAFECPAEHVEVLKSRLPDVTKVLIIGWRGQEPHFRSLLSEKLRPGIRGLIVAGTVEGAQQVGVGLREAGVHVTFGYSEGGFSDLLKGPLLERFFQV
jgi:hypothetical protein